MISQNVIIQDVDVEQWLNVFKLAAGKLPPREKTSRPGDAAGKKKRGRSTLRLIVEDGRCLKAFHGEKGPLRDYSPLTTDDPAALAEAEGVGRVIIIERGTPRKIMHRVQSGLTLDMNFGQQALLIYGEIRKEMGQGIKIHPRPKMPDVKYGAINTAVKFMAPPNELIMVAIYDESGEIRDSRGLPIVWSGIMRLDKDYNIDLLSTTDSLVSAGLKVSDWKKDFESMNALAKKVWQSNLFAAYHLPLTAVPELVKRAKSGNPGKALLEMRKEKKIIIDPFPLRLRTLLKMGGMMKIK